MGTLEFFAWSANFGGFNTLYFYISFKCEHCQCNGYTIYVLEPAWETSYLNQHWIGLYYWVICCSCVTSHNPNNIWELSNGVKNDKLIITLLRWHAPLLASLNLLPWDIGFWTLVNLVVYLVIILFSLPLLTLACSIAANSSWSQACNIDTTHLPFLPVDFVLYMPNCPFNLLSINRLTNSHDIIFKLLLTCTIEYLHVWVVSDESNGLYYLSPWPPTCASNVSPDYLLNSP